jgi:tetratricopeptide (TPR) repeat protein
MESVPPEELPGVKESRAIVHYTLSNWYFYRWNLQLAEVELEEAIKYWPDFKAAHRDLCLVSLFRGNIGRSIAELMMVVGMGEPIPLNEEEKWDLNKRALQLHYKKGVEQGRKGHWNDAVAEFQWCLVYDKNDPVVHRSLAFAYSSLGEFGQAEAQYEQSFKLDPSDAFGRADFAFLLSSQGDKDRALAQLSKAVKMSPAVAALHVDLGWMAEARGDLHTAAREFQNAANLTPSHAWIWVRLGGILERQGKPEEAIKAYDKAIALDPELSEATQALQRLKSPPKEHS